MKQLNSKTKSYLYLKDVKLVAVPAYPSVRIQVVFTTILLAERQEALPTGKEFAFIVT